MPRPLAGRGRSSRRIGRPGDARAEGAQAAAEPEAFNTTTSSPCAFGAHSRCSARSLRSRPWPIGRMVDATRVGRVCVVVPTAAVRLARVREPSRQGLRAARNHYPDAEALGAAGKRRPDRAAEHAEDRARRRVAQQVGPGVGHAGDHVGGGVLAQHQRPQGPGHGVPVALGGDGGRPFRQAHHLEARGTGTAARRRPRQRDAPPCGSLHRMKPAHRVSYADSFVGQSANQLYATWGAPVRAARLPMAARSSAS